MQAALATMDGYVAGLPAHLRGQLRVAIRIFQWCPAIFIAKPRLFTGLSTADQATYIRTWAESRFRMRRRVFRALRDLALLGYYNQPGPRAAIGHVEDAAL